MPNPLLWGALAGVMRFIPYVGPVVGAVIPLILSFAVSDSWMTPIYTLGLFLVLELINANALEPWLYLEHRGFLDRADPGGGFLDVAVGAGGAAPVDAADCLPRGNGTARAESAILERAPE